MHECRGGYRRRKSARPNGFGPDRHGISYFSNNIDQRLYRQDASRPPSPITPAPAGAAADAFRYADGVIDRRRGRMVCVREDHTGAGEAITTLVAVDLSDATATHTLVSGNDFYSTPRCSDCQNESRERMEQRLAESYPGISRLSWARSEPLAHEVELTPQGSIAAGTGTPG